MLRPYVLCYELLLCKLDTCLDFQCFIHVRSINKESCNEQVLQKLECTVGLKWNIASSAAVESRDAT